MQRFSVFVMLAACVILSACGGGQIGPNDPDFSFATAPSPRPAGNTCIGREGAAIAKEMINIRSFEIVLGGGANPMPDDEWTDFRPRLPWMKNSTRFLLFDDSCFFRSPGAAPTCVGADCTIFIEEFDHSWLLMTTMANVSCLPAASGCNGAEVAPGFLSVNTIDKCQQLTFNGPTIYELSDPAGNRYVMHATATGTPNISDVQLPEGWQLQARTIDQPLVIEPVGGGEHCYYNILRDNLVQSYHQYVFAGSQWP